MEETLKLEDEENLLNQKIEFHQNHSSEQAAMLAKKHEEHVAEQQELLLEEGERRAKVNKMVKQSDGSLGPIKDVLVNLEGILYLCIYIYLYIYFSFNSSQIGSFNKLNRQVKYGNECQRLSADRSGKIENCLLELLKETKEVKQQLIQYNYHVRMDSVDISHLFPLGSEADIATFMKHDENWNQRRKASYD